MNFIGITGGVGAGKSAILDYLSQKKNTRVMLADAIDAVDPDADTNNGGKTNTGR